ncbi:JAB domain-containing protein [uncultured Lactobacillus sp.]|uniref:JAB domain-containing protein n=1 Tax=uncultured Lactobacillus sp. TaxID=153152 RepID=UPI002604ADE8|nr:JAB domain-containing protein [uncultured Lactobacillus sp.]
METLKSKHYLLKDDRQLIEEILEILHEENIRNFDDLQKFLDKNGIVNFSDFWNYCSGPFCSDKLALWTEIFIKRIKALNTGNLEKFMSSSQVGYYLASKMSGQNQEQLYGIYLDSKNKIVAEKLIFQGTLNKAVVHPRDIFRWALIYNCASFFVVHNHPSGDTTPSAQDLKITKQIKKTSEAIGIQFMDHFIVSDNTYLSFRESELL